MARPKGSKNNKVKASQSVEETKNKSTTVVNHPTEVKKVELKPIIVERPLSIGDTFLIIVDGADKYWTRSMIDVGVRRGVQALKFPKGALYQPIGEQNCVDCG